jgi:hypothetical protein
LINFRRKWEITPVIPSLLEELLFSGALLSSYCAPMEYGFKVSNKAKIKAMYSFDLDTHDS